ncbi:XPO5 [Bugula neritina]|uniref:XPO5 n=1 Tax=Bugula neritina TaxID=10212 RepID=A0A7J7JMT5_BUGNE|nr:XPO5 [Bugula neritina]
MMDGTSPSTSENVSLEDKLSDFVLGLPQEEVLYLLWFATISSCWLDSGTVHKAIDLVTPLVRYTHTSGWMTPDIADQVTRTLLTCIHTHGKHDTISTKVFSSLLIVYEMLRPTFGNLSQLMLEIPGVTVKRLNRFEAEICLPGAKPSPKVANSNGTYFPCFKKRRELLRSMIVEIIGKDVSEQFKNNVVIRNLPPLIKKRIKKSEDIIAASGGDKESLGLCQMFQPSS